MKDFTLAGEIAPADRSFGVNGHEFEFGPFVGAKALSDFSDWIDDRERGRKEQILPARSFERLTGLVRDCLLTGSRERWDAFIAEETDRPLTLDQLVALFDHICEVNAGVPTLPPSPSGGTGESATTRSTDGSASPADAALAGSTSGRF